MLESDIQEICSSIDLKPFEGKRVLITGACGFLGRYFVEVLVKVPGIQIFAVDNNITSSDRDLVRDRKSISYLFMNVNHGFEPTYYEPFPFKRPDFVLHLAGIASPFHYRNHPLETLEVATKGLKHVLEFASEGEARTLFFSSSEIYGDPTPGNVPTPETYNGNVSCLGPRACYDESKRLGETICRIYAEQYNLPVMMVRPFNVFGPGMRQDDYRVLPQIASSIVSKKPFQIYGSGKQTRTYCYVTDAIRGFLQVLLNGRAGEAYNVGNPYPEVSVEELVWKVKRDVEIDFLSQYHGGQGLDKQVYDVKTDSYVLRPEYPSEYPGDEPQRRCPDIRKIEALGYEPQVTLKQGLKRFFGWALKEYRA